MSTVIRKPNILDNDSIAPNGRPVAENFRNWFKDGKVADRDGPMIVYHSTGSAFDVFDFPPLGFHFAGDPGLATNAAIKGGKSGSTNMQVYINLQNPVEITGQANGFTVFRLLDDLHERGHLTEEKYNRLMDQYEAAEAGIADMQDAEGRRALLKMTRAIAKDIGADGFKYWNAFDSGLNLLGGGRDVVPGWSYIALSANQIKSAVGNAGTFSEDDPSITDARSAPSAKLARSAKACAAAGTARGRPASRP